MSQLIGIISRLQNLQEQSSNGEVFQRFFEINGERKCGVKYFHHSNTFELEIYQKGEPPKSYQFDDIDMIAIEIYELLN
jgi:uncharacterized protein YkuJ